MLTVIHTAYPSVYFLMAIIGVFLLLLVWGLKKPLRHRTQADDLSALQSQLNALIHRAQSSLSSRIHNQKIQIFRAEQLIAIVALNPKKAAQAINIRQLDDVWVIQFDKLPSQRQLKKLLQSHQIL